MAPSIQLCDGGSKVQLCDGGNRVQLGSCVPTSCPCENWPSTADGFPCGGLTYQYDITPTYTSPHGDGATILYRITWNDGSWHEITTENQSTATATAHIPCWWITVGGHLRYTENGSVIDYWVDVPIHLLLYDGWRILSDANLSYIEKSAGITPEGNYTGIGNTEGSATVSAV